MAKMTLDDLVSQLRSAFGAELRAVVLYGSAVTSNPVPKHSDLNTLVLVDSLAADRLAGASAACRAWVDAGNPAPLTLTLQEWRGSADIFPMEYADVLERHKVLHGELPTDIKVSPEHLRLELEHEAMGTLLQLRRGALAAGNDGRAQIALLEASASTVMVIFRAVLRLRNEAVPMDNAALVDRVAELASTDSAPFQRVLRHKRGEMTLRPADAGPVLAAYLDGVQRLATWLDQFRPGRR